jgi:hypothetical protein
MEGERESFSNAPAHEENRSQNMRRKQAIARDFIAAFLRGIGIRRPPQWVVGLGKARKSQGEMETMCLITHKKRGFGGLEARKTALDSANQSKSTGDLVVKNAKSPVFLGNFRHNVARPESMEQTWLPKCLSRS